MSIFTLINYEEFISLLKNAEPKDCSENERQAFIDSLNFYAREIKDYKIENEEMKSCVFIKYSDYKMLLQKAEFNYECPNR
jgi:hypothetical protein